MTAPDVTIVCNVPRCDQQSIFSRYGMVGGRYWPMCPDHAREWLGDHIARMALLSDALEGLPAAAQLTLIEGV